MERAVFLDRDGVINEVILRDGSPCSPGNSEEFVWARGIKEAVAKIRAAGFRVFVVSNQPDVSRKKIDISLVHAFSEKIQRVIDVDEILICPHDDHEGCACRKPKPGMLVSLAQKWKIDVRSSFMIGDTAKDMEAGKKAGCQTILIRRAYNQGVAADYKVEGVEYAADVILNSHQRRLKK